VPPGLDEIAKRFNELKVDKEKVDIARNQIDSLKEKFTKNNNKYDKLIWTLDKKSRELKNMNPTNIYHYNNLVSDINSLNADYQCNRML